MSSHSVIGPIIWCGPVPSTIPHAHPEDFYRKIKSLPWTLTNKRDLCLEMGRFYKWWPPAHLGLSIHCYLIYSLLINWKWLLFPLQWKLDWNTPQKLTLPPFISPLSSVSASESFLLCQFFPKRTGYRLCPALERSSIFRYKLYQDVTLWSV